MQIGNLNKNWQMVIERTDLPGTDKYAKVSVLECRRCGLEYGANGQDVWERKCPSCDKGRPGLAVPPHTVWLQYWKRAQISREVGRGVLNHSGGDQLARVEVGDVVWIVGKGVTDVLVTIGPIRVGEISSSEREVERRLGYKPWDARWHILADPELCEVPLEVSLDGILLRLRFDSKRSPTLSIDSGVPLGQRLQAMRRLTNESARL
ncbi:MAG: hypothetical protein WBH56_03935, partial [Bacteroidota bacterium]